ncbi:MAG: outer membrane beta-barrel protein [Pseudomonadota bacterium]
MRIALLIPFALMAAWPLTPADGKIRLQSLPSISFDWSAPEWAKSTWRRLDKTVYTDIGYSHVTFLTEEDIGFDSESHSYLGHVGWDFSRYFSTEMEITFASKAEDGDENGTNLEFEPSFAIGSYIMARYPLTDKVTPFVRVGYVYTDAEVRTDFVGFQTTNQETYGGTSYGGGIRWKLGRTKSSIRAEYSRYNLDEIEADAWTLAFQRKF